MEMIVSNQSNINTYTFTESYSQIFIVLTGGRTRDVSSLVNTISLSNGSEVTEDYYIYGKYNVMGSTTFDTTTYVAHAYDIAADTTLSITFNGNAWYFGSLNIVGIK